MAKKDISSGTVHKLPADLHKALMSDEKARVLWQGLTPLARNEWICWVTSVKRQEQERIMSKEWSRNSTKECVDPVAGSDVFTVLIKK